MSLQEHIAQIIDPGAWETDAPGNISPHWRESRQRKAAEKAQAVIDELDLKQETRGHPHYPSSHASPPTGGSKVRRHTTPWEEA